MITTIATPTTDGTLYRMDLDEATMRQLSEGLVSPELQHHAREWIDELNLEIAAIIEKHKAQREATLAKLARENKELRREVQKRKTA